MTRKPKPRTKRADGAEKIAANHVAGVSCIEDLRWEEDREEAECLVDAIRRYASSSVAAERKRCIKSVHEAMNLYQYPVDPKLARDAIIETINRHPGAPK